MYDLTNYEMLDLALSHIANATDDLNRAAAATTAYLLVAYRAGKELTRFQVIVINVFFVTIVLQALLGAGGENASAIRYWREVHGSHAGAQNELVGLVGRYLGIGAITVCLAFMWRVRHPKKE